MAETVSRAVSYEELNRLLHEIETSSPQGPAGIFGPESITWKVNRESALFLAAGRAALLQLAHPWVAAAIAQHSRTLHDPIGRFHQTFRVMFTMVFGSLDQALAASRQLHRRHEAIQGTLSQSAGAFLAGDPYQANELAALRWVYATLVDSALLSYELVLPSLAEAERERYYVESWNVAALFGLPREYLPPSWSEFRQYMDAIIQSGTLGVSSETRAMARQLHSGAGMKLRPPGWYQALTLHLLPLSLRQEFQLACGDTERRSAERALTWLRRIYPRLPSVFRFVGPYNEARSRLDGRPNPSLGVRFSNQLWIGRPSMFNSRSES